MPNEEVGSKELGLTMFKTVKVKAVSPYCEIAEFGRVKFTKEELTTLQAVLIALMAQVIEPR